MKKFETLVAEGDNKETEDVKDESEDKESGTEKMIKQKTEGTEIFFPQMNTSCS